MFNREDEGRRVRLVQCSDEFTDLKPGDEGTVRFVDDMGTNHVEWDNGSNLGLVPNEDRWQYIN